MLQESADQLGSDLSAPVAGCHPDFIDPEFRPWLVRMEVVDSRRETDNGPFRYGDHQMKTVSEQKLACRVEIDLVVEDLRGNLAEHQLITRLQEEDLAGKSLLPGRLRCARGALGIPGRTVLILWKAQRGWHWREILQLEVLRHPFEDADRGRVLRLAHSGDGATANLSLPRQRPLIDFRSLFREPCLRVRPGHAIDQSSVHEAGEDSLDLRPIAERSHGFVQLADRNPLGFADRVQDLPAGPRQTTPLLGVIDVLRQEPIDLAEPMADGKMGVLWFRHSRSAPGVL